MSSIEQDRLSFNRAKRADRGTQDNDPVRVYMLMRSAFRRGLLSTAESLTEAALVIRFGATREAVRYSLRKFTDEGLLRRQPRSGTWFTAEPGKILGDRMFPLLRGARNDVSTLVALDESVVASSQIMRELLETDATQFVRYEQLLLLRGVPTAARTLYIPMPYLAGRMSELADDAIPLTGGYEPDFEALFGMKLGKIDSVIEAVAALENNPPLEVVVGDILLSRETLAYDRDGLPRMLAYTSYKATLTSIHVTGEFQD